MDYLPLIGKNNSHAYCEVKVKQENEVEELRLLQKSNVYQITHAHKIALVQSATSLIECLILLFRVQSESRVTHWHARHMAVPR